MAGRSREYFVSTLWRGADPFVGAPRHLYQLDKGGWSSSTHRFLHEAIDRVRSRLIVEVGVWKGRSVMHMARHLRDLDMHDTTILAVDTWLGSAEHWLRDDYYADLSCSSGYPALYHKFLANILSEDLARYVVPLPLDSINAAEVLLNLEVEPDIVHLDGGHDYASVSRDLEKWWPLLAGGGVLVGDDWSWAEVRRAFRDYFKAQGLGIVVDGNKCLVEKPGLGTDPLPTAARGAASGPPVTVDAPPAGTAGGSDAA